MLFRTSALFQDELSVTTQPARALILYTQHSFIRIISVLVWATYVRFLFATIGCPNKNTRFKVRTLSSPTTQQSRGGHLSDIVLHN